MKRIFPILVLSILLTALLIGCYLSTANIDDVKMCEELNGELCEYDVEVFSADVPKFFVSCKLKNAPDDTQVTFSWYYFGEEKQLIDEVTISSEEKGATLELHSSLARSTDAWPLGKYEVVIKIHTDNSKPIVKSFKVE